ncbi:unnamed protein product [Anisakis simplex]|uniref:BRK domain-containing protein n=1 Tax=Anisakis simplex TaxID=6269 RepID=A0A0M3JKF3_ANISI|nr:unnamed protein product [Anisakis simplex]
MLQPDEAPKAEEVDAWLETHPGYEVNLGRWQF